jgi:RNA polymerase sigma-70 factor (ECF subfamily)
MPADVPREGPRSAEDNAGMMGRPAIEMTRIHERQDAFVEALTARDAQAWRTLFDENYRRIFGYAYVRVGTVADAQDVASNVFAEAVRSIGTFRYRGIAVTAWLLRIAHNETVDLLKRRRRRAETQMDAEGIESIVARDTIAESGEWRDVSDALDALKPEQRAIVQLRLIEGRSVAEVASLLGKTEGAVKVAQMRALKSMRKRLQA